MGPGSECSDTPERFDFGEYLDFLEERGHNFIRLWRWGDMTTKPGCERGPRDERSAMSKVLLELSVSLDGFVAGPDIGPGAPLGIGGSATALFVSTSPRPQRPPTKEAR